MEAIDSKYGTTTKSGKDVQKGRNGGRGRTAEHMRIHTSFLFLLFFLTCEEQSEIVRDRGRREGVSKIFEAPKR